MRSLLEEMENDSSKEEMAEDEPIEEGIGTRVIGNNKTRSAEYHRSYFAKFGFLAFKSVCYRTPYYVIETN